MLFTTIPTRNGDMIQSDRHVEPFTAESETPTMELIAELNNEGASHLENSLFTEAIATFSSTLSLVINGNETCSDSNGEDATVASQLRAAAVDITGSNNLTVEVASADAPPTAATKPKKTRRRKHKRRNSLGSAGSKDSSVAAGAPSRPHRSRDRGSRRRRVRSLMGRMHAKHGDVPVTEDIAQIPQKYVYARPLRVMDRYSPPSTVELTIYMVYNLALAYHLKTRSENPVVIEFPLAQEIPSTWTRIVNLYKLASSLLEQEQQKLDEDEDAVAMDPNSPLWSPTYTIALLNNLACAYHSSSDDVHANEIWEQALAHLWCILDVGCTEQVECFTQVLENAAHLMDPDHQVNRTASAA